MNNRGDLICGLQRHEDIKKDTGEWLRFTDTNYAAIVGDGEGGRLELRNCTACGSTLARPVRS